jgi:hypothetical protein
MGANGQEGACTLGLVWNNHGQFTASRLRGTREPNRDLTVTSGSIKQDMQIHFWIGIENELLEKRHTVAEYCVDQDDETAVILRFVNRDQSLAFIARSVLRFVERASVNQLGK